MPPKAADITLTGFAKSSEPDPMEAVIAAHGSALVPRRQPPPPLQQNAKHSNTAQPHAQQQTGENRADQTASVARAAGAEVGPLVVGVNTTAGDDEGAAPPGAVKLAAWQLPRFVGDGIEPNLPSVRFLPSQNSHRFVILPLHCQLS